MVGCGDSNAGTGVGEGGVGEGGYGGSESPVGGEGGVDSDGDRAGSGGCMTWLVTARDVTEVTARDVTEGDDGGRGDSGQAAGDGVGAVRATGERGEGGLVAGA